MNNSKTKSGSTAKGKATENGRGKSTSAKKNSGTILYAIFTAHETL